MLVRPITINLNSYGKNTAMNAIGLQNNYNTTKTDCVSFGNAELKAKEATISIVKDIFKELEGWKKTNSAKAQNTMFEEATNNAFKKLSGIFENIKQIKWPTSAIELEDGSHIKPYKIFGSYIFDHEPAYGKDLFNYIAIDSTGAKAEISSYLIKGKKIVTKSAKGSLN